MSSLSVVRLETEKDVIDQLGVISGFIEGVPIDTADDFKVMSSTVDSFLRVISEEQLRIMVRQLLVERKLASDAARVSSRPCENK